VSAVSYTLTVDDLPVSGELLAAVQQIEVEDNADMADMVRLRIGIGVKDGCSDWTVLDEDLFHRLAKIRILVTVGSRLAEPLIETYVIENNASFSNQPGQSVLNVVAMDPTTLMNLEPRVRPWPDLADSDIAATIFGEYKFTPDVEQTRPARQEIDHTTMQRATDIQFLRELAMRNGFECYVEINPRTGLVDGHFHRPRLEQTSQGVLSVNIGEATNVNSFSPRNDMLRPAAAQATGVDVDSVEEQPTGAEGQSLRGLGSEPTLPGDRPRRVLITGSGLTRVGELQTFAQAVVDRSAWSITADGDLNTVAYGGILRAKRPVEVRGASRQFSGTYYVEKVLHTFTTDRYTQRFTLRRNARTLTGHERFTEDLALP
jgi:phage protein D